MPVAGLAEIAAGDGVNDGVEQWAHGQKRHGRAALFLLDVGDGVGGKRQRRGPRAAHNEAEADEHV